MLQLLDQVHSRATIAQQHLNASRGERLISPQPGALNADTPCTTAFLNTLLIAVSTKGEAMNDRQGCH